MSSRLSSLVAGRGVTANFTAGFGQLNLGQLLMPGIGGVNLEMCRTVPRGN